MGIRYLSQEREDNLIEINVYGHGCIEGIYTCEGRFNTNHIFKDGFKPDDGWYRIADYSIHELKAFKNKGITITCSNTCENVRKAIEKD